MKTKINKSGNRNRYFQMIVLLTGTILLSSAVGGKTQPALSTGKTNVDTASRSVVTEQMADKELELESWMTDDVYFGACINALQLEEEPQLDIEPWMANEAFFADKQTYEKPTEIEPWMTDDKYWNPKSHLIAQDDEALFVTENLKNCQ